MNTSYIRQHWLEYTLIGVWIFNCIIASLIAVREVWIPHMNAGVDSYTHIRSAPFDGTVYPISYIPDWTKPANQDKQKTFDQIDISDYIPLPSYDARTLASDLSNTTKMSTILHYTYTVPYMWSYKFNYKENDGSHLWVDIRAPIGTPILSIANGVVIRTVEADNTGNKYVVIRHDDVPMNGTKTSLYSAYLHLSQINVTEWKLIKKWELLGRVGMTGITTAPHLHFQIDTLDAPFHPYWPFTSADSRNAGLGFFESINAGLWKENALKYTIHPLNFVNAYIAGIPSATFSSAPIDPPIQTIAVTNTLTEEQSIREREILLGWYVSSWAKRCRDIRFADVNAKTKFWKDLYTLIDEKCLFQKDGKFNARESITRRELIETTMDYYGIDPATGTSHFLDLTIGDDLQWYALVLYRRGIVDGNYLAPDRVVTKAEAIDMVVKIWGITKNPSQLRIYPDVTSLHPYFESVQAYGLATRVRGWRFYPDSILTRANFVTILTSLSKITK